MKKGFTLVELLAVIAILAILVIIALPNVMGMFNTAKENSFRTEIKEVFKTAEQQWIQDSMYNTGEQTYRRCSGCNGKSLNLSGRTELEYYIKFNKSGEVVEFKATDGTFQYSYKNSSTPLKIENINSVQRVADITNSEDIIDFSNMKNILKFCYDYTNKEYEYEEGMTWEEYVNSSYFNEQEWIEHYEEDDYDWYFFPNGFIDKNGNTSYHQYKTINSIMDIPDAVIRPNSDGCYDLIPQ